MPETEKYHPAVLLGRKGKGIRRNFSRAERQRRRERLIALNKARALARREAALCTQNTSSGESVMVG